MTASEHQQLQNIDSFRTFTASEHRQLQNIDSFRTLTASEHWQLQNINSFRTLTASEHWVSEHWQLENINSFRTSFRTSTASEHQQLKNINSFRTSTASEHQQLQNINSFRTLTSAEHWQLQMLRALNHWKIHVIISNLRSSLKHTIRSESCWFIYHISLLLNHVHSAAPEITNSVIRITITRVWSSIHQGTAHTSNPTNIWNTKVFRFWCRTFSATRVLLKNPWSGLNWIMT